MEVGPHKGLHRCHLHAEEAEEEEEGLVLLTRGEVEGEAEEAGKRGVTIQIHPNFCLFCFFHFSKNVL